MHVRVGGRAVVDGKVHVEAELLSTYVPRRQAGTEAT